MDRFPNSFGDFHGIEGISANTFILASVALNLALLLGFWINFRRVPPAKASSSPPLKDVSSKSANKTMLPTPEQTALLISSRRSIYTKDFSGEKVERKVVESMLEAANWAPTHGKTEPWRFVVMSREQLLHFVDVMIEALDLVEGLTGKEGKAAKLNSKKSKMQGVSWAVVICYKRQAGDKLMPEWEELAATSSAVQNMHLQAWSQAVAGYWTSWGPAEARDSLHVKKYLGLEEEDKCIGVFLLGRSDRADSYRASRGPIAEKVDWRL